MTILEATVDEGKESLLQGAFENAGAGAIPPGLVRSELLQDPRDKKVWRIQTLWASYEALQKLRSSGETPAGILMFREAGAEPAFSVFNVVDVIQSNTTSHRA
ncbi:MAG TPA: antibiotic biosynthesis monooxygenase [Gemmatimonadaceae bacterium]|nr:antibiotic biosynthesis monooxygenase [Gemmatimonadaceae bacterium]